MHYSINYRDEIVWVALNVPYSGIGNIYCQLALNLPYITKGCVSVCVHVCVMCVWSVHVCVRIIKVHIVYVRQIHNTLHVQRESLQCIALTC